jgi:transcriptional regulator with XRE-family HTH domain
LVLISDSGERLEELMEAATIGSALGRRRRDLGIGQNDAATLIGMSRTTFSSYERDLQRPSVEVLPALAKFLGVTIEEILVLYGATCIEALRPALEQFLSSGETGSTKSPPDHSEEPIYISSTSEKPLSEAQNAPDAPDVPADPDVPAVSDVPAVPDVPTVPDVPAVPDVPTVPDVPAVPDVSTVPDVPAVPEVPDVSAALDEPMEVQGTREEITDSVRQIGVSTEPSVSIFANELSNGHGDSAKFENEIFRSSTKKKKKKKKHTKH